MLGLSAETAQEVQYQRVKKYSGKMANVWDDMSTFVTYDDLVKDV